MAPAQGWHAQIEKCKHLSTARGYDQRDYYHVYYYYYYYYYYYCLLPLLLLLLLFLVLLLASYYHCCRQGPPGAGEAAGPADAARPVCNCVADTVSFHNFKAQQFKLSVSNPKNKYVAYLSALSQISNCRGLGRKNKYDILKTDRKWRFDQTCCWMDDCCRHLGSAFRQRGRMSPVGAARPDPAT